MKASGSAAYRQHIRSYIDTPCLRHRIGAERQHHPAGAMAIRDTEELKCAGSGACASSAALYAPRPPVKNPVTVTKPVGDAGSGVSVMINSVPSIVVSEVFVPRNTSVLVPKLSRTTI